MKLSLSNAAILAVCLSELAASAPAPQYEYWENTPVCTSEREEDWRNTKEETYEGEPELVTGSSCETLPEAGCTIAKVYNWGKSTTWTVGMGAIPSMDVGKLLNLAGLPTFSYSWATTKGEATSTAAECPKGEGWSCGLRATPNMVKITGEYAAAIDKYGLCEDKGWQAFEIHSVRIKKARSLFMSGEGIQDGADIRFGICLENCVSAEACKTAKEKGLTLCPATDKPEFWEDTTDQSLVAPLDLGLGLTLAAPPGSGSE